MCEPDNSPKEKKEKQEARKYGEDPFGNKMDHQTRFSPSKLYLIIMKCETQLAFVRAQMVLHKVRVLVNVYGF